VAGEFRCRPVTLRAGLWVRYISVIGLAGLLTAFAAMQSLIPLGSAIKLGADEDHELPKATLCNHGYKLYTQIWNDQPPLITQIIAAVTKQAPHSVLAPRLFTVGSASLLLAAMFMMVCRVSGLLAAAVAAAMLIGSPGFLELSSSVMQEIPAFASGNGFDLAAGPTDNERVPR
jgi:hypothetical protein